MSKRTRFIAKNLTATGIPAHDPHGSPCHIAYWLTYYAEKQNGLPSRLALDPDGAALGGQEAGRYGVCSLTVRVARSS